LACIRVLTSLARQAEGDGGEVILLHGNHEALNAVGMFRYVDGEEVERDLTQALDSRVGERDWRREYGRNNPVRWATFEPGGFLSKPLYQSMRIAVVLGDTVFVHAGLTAAHVNYYNGLEGMNNAARDWYATGHYIDDPLLTAMSVKDKKVNGPAERRSASASETLPPCLGGTLSNTMPATGTTPTWMRNYSSPSDAPPSDPNAQSDIDEALRSLGPDVARMVVGHTPQSRINCGLGGKIWRIDVGASKGVRGGVPEVLEIVHKGGEDGEDLVSVLTVGGMSVPEKDRRVGFWTDSTPDIPKKKKRFDFF